MRRRRLGGIIGTVTTMVTKDLLLIECCDEERDIRTISGSGQKR